MALDSNQIVPLTLYQKETIQRISEDIIGGLSPFALKELLGGNYDDLGTFLNTLYFEVGNVLFRSIDSPVKGKNFFYLEELSKSIDEGLKVLSLNYFQSTVLSDFDVNWHHIEWANLIQIYKNLAILAARDHGKSYEFSFAYPLWNLYRGSDKGFIPASQQKLLKLVIIVSNAISLGITLLQMIKDEIERNPFLNEKLYKNFKRWGSEEIQTSAGTTLFVRGYTGQLRGYHPGWMIVDDMLDESQLYSKEQRESLIDLFYSVITNMVLPGGDLKVVGTPFHINDLYGSLKKDFRFRVFEYPSIFPNGKVLWRGRYSFSDLMEKRKSMGNIRFTREHLVKPVSSDSSIFPWEILRTSEVGMDKVTLVNNIESFPIPVDKVVVACDLALSANIGADFSVFGVVGYSETTKRFYLLYVWRERGKSYGQQIAKVKELNFNFRPHVVVVEINGFQEAFAQTLEEDGLPILRNFTSNEKKSLMDGLPSLSVLFEQGRILFPRGDEHSRNLADIICSEFSSITFSNSGKLESSSEHDDTAMMLYLAIKKGVPYVHSRLSLDFL